MRKLCIKKGVISLFFLLISCNSPPCQQWRYDAVITGCRAYNSVQLTLPPADLKSISVDLVHGVNGTRMYINTLSIPFPCDSGKPEKIYLNYKIDSVWCGIEVDRLQGGQRLLLPEFAVQHFIEALLKNKSIQINVERYDVTIVSTGFSELYSKLS